MPRAKAAKLPVGEIDAATAARLVHASSDIALVLDDAGTILDVMAQDEDLAQRAVSHWRGRPWSQTVTVESRQKVEALLRDAATSVAEGTRWRQVNHATAEGVDLPMLYSVVRLGDADDPPARRRLLAFGRDLSATVALQRRLVETQQSMERDYWRFREAETRFRQLFESSGEAVVVLDGATLKVVDANPSAKELFEGQRGRLTGAPVLSLFSAADGERLQQALAAARSAGRQEPVRVALAADDRPVTVAASVYRQDKSTYALLRIVPLQRAGNPLPAMGEAGTAPALTRSPARSALWQGYLEHAPDALVFCDANGTVQVANRAFLALAQLSSEDQVRGRPLDVWVGRTGVEVGVLMATLRERGSVALFATEFKGQYGASTQIEISACALPQDDGESLLAFALRDIERRVEPAPRSGEGVWARSPAELAELVGRTPLKDIVSETTDVIEQMCIQAALQMTNDNRASAAQLLGLSRQSLYVKLRRFGMIGAGDVEV
ncbi:MAG: transcriptional regulator PpsR [Rubrivivax sp.]|jgi:transcriptional regulator PpsR